MKKILMFFAAAVLFCGCSQDRTSLLKVYNWSDYIDESVIPEFEEWYKEQTGESVKVIYQTFDINETMLSKIEKGHEDFDVVCPSDYIIERMLKEDMLLPIDRDFGETPNYIDGNVSPFVKKNFEAFHTGGKNANDYSVGYMWGTTGILYNAAHVSDEDANTWDVIRNHNYAGRIFIKDSARDVYSQLILKTKEEDLAEGRVTADELMEYSGDENIALVEKYMSDVKTLVAGWEADFGKDQMVQEIGWVNLTWSGDAVWAIEEADSLGVELKFALPQEGFTVWFDGWVIPKYAQNTKAAKYWINFLNRPDIVTRNSDATGYVACSGAAEVMEAFEDEEYPAVDLSYFFGEEADSVHINPVLYPDKADIDRSTVEHDWGADTEKLIQMWGRIKGDNASPMTAVVIGVCLVALIVGMVMSKKKKTSHRKRK